MDLTFELGDTVVYQLTILNKVLDDLGLPAVFENSDFIIHKSSSTFGLDMSVVRLGRNTVPIDFSLEGGGMRIDIDTLPETYEWANKNLEDPKEVSYFIKQLFTSYVLMEYYGTHTVMCLFDIKGQLIYKRTLRYHSLIGSFFKRDCQEKLFLPIYPQSK